MTVSGVNILRIYAPPRPISTVETSNGTAAWDVVVAVFTSSAAGGRQRSIRAPAWRGDAMPEMECHRVTYTACPNHGPNWPVFRYLGNRRPAVERGDEISHHGRTEPASRNRPLVYQSSGTAVCDFARIRRRRFFREKFYHRCLHEQNDATTISSTTKVTDRNHYLRSRIVQLKTKREEERVFVLALMFMV